MTIERKQMAKLSNAAVILALGFNGCMSLTLDETCEAIGISKSTAAKLIYAGQFPIPMTKEGRAYVVDIRDVGDYLDARRARAHKAA